MKKTHKLTLHEKHVIIEAYQEVARIHKTHFIEDMSRKYKVTTRTIYRVIGGK